MRGIILRSAVILALAGWRLSHPIPAAAAAGPCNIQFCDGDCSSGSMCPEGCPSACIITANCPGGGSDYQLATTCNYIE